MKKWLTTASFVVSLVLWALYGPDFAWAQLAEGDNALYLPMIQSNYDPSWQWGQAELVNLTPSPLNNPLLAIDHSGRVHIFWDTWGFNGAAFIYHSYQTESGWTDPTPVANTLGVSKTVASPLVTPDSRIHLVWYNQLASGGPYRLLYANFDGSQWSPEEEIARFTYPNPGAILNYDDKGNLHIVYLEPTIIKYHYYHQVRIQGAWSPLVDITPDTGGSIIIWKVWPDSAGGVRFFGRDLNHHLVYSYWKDGAFQVNLSPLADATWPDYSILDAKDNLHAYRFDDVPVPGNTVSGLYHQCLDSNLIWGPEQILSGSDPVGGSPAPARDNAGNLAFGWKDFSAPRFSLALLNGCSQPERKSGQFPDTSRTGYLSAIALSSQPGKFCALAEILYQSETQELLWTNISK